MAGIVSHVPGGIGVFETLVIAAMPTGTPVDKVAVALLLYRLVYCLLPFLIALAVLAIYEGWSAAGGHVAGGEIGLVLATMEPSLRAVAPFGLTGPRRDGLRIGIVDEPFGSPSNHI